MLRAYEWHVARRLLWGRRREGFLHVITGFSFLGICLGVATLIIVMSVMNGFRQELLDKTLKFNSHLSVIPIGKVPSKNYAPLLQKAKSLPNIQHIYPVVEGHAMVSFKDRALGLVVKGIPQEDFLKKNILTQNIFSGSLADFFKDHNSIMVGIRLAEHLNLKVGDTLTLIAPQGNFTPFGRVPRFQNFTLQAIFNSGMFQFDKNVAFLPFTSAQEFFNLEDQISHLETHLKNPYEARSIAQTLEAFSSPLPLYFISWSKAHASLFEALNIERNVMFLILTLIILIAAFNIISGLVMIVKDKVADIAILKTMGMTRTSILKIFLLVGCTIGMGGALLGTLLGLLFSLNIESIRQFLEGLTGKTIFDAEIYFLSHLPAIVDYREVITIVVMTLCIAFLATLYPAWRASKLNPVEGLRHG